GQPTPAPRTPGKVLFQDPLTDNKNQWTLDSSQNEAYFQDGKLHLVSRSQGKTFRTWPDNAPKFDDFSYEVTAQQIEGPDDFGYEDTPLSGRIGVIVGTDSLHAAFANVSVRSVGP